MRTSKIMVLAAAAVSLFRASAWAQFDGTTIYGDDDRRDLYQVKNPQIRKLADSTVALFEGYKVTLDPAKREAQLATMTFGQEMGLCKEEPFFDEPTGAFCSGSLVGPDLIMTAGHCIADQASCKTTKFIFDFAVKSQGQYPKSVPAGEVYGCAELLGREQVGDGADWALVRLDRKVTGRKPLALNRSGKIADGAPLVVIGHPSGLPTKVAGGAVVRDASRNGYFVANTDTFGGNSGSAVFNAQTGLVEGILVRGEQDFEARGQCRVSKRCPADGCRGEDVTKISAVTGLIPPLRLGRLHRSELERSRVAGPSATLSELLKIAGVEAVQTPSVQ